MSSLVTISISHFAPLHGCQILPNAGRKMASDGEVKLTETDIKSLAKEQENTNMKKETSHDLEQFKEYLPK